MTKLFLSIALVFIGYLAQAQCDNFITYTEDPISGVGNWGSVEPPVFSEDGKTGMVSTLILSADRKSVIWVLTSTELSCVDDDATVGILFTDDSKTSFQSNNKFNCKGKTTSYFGDLFRKRDIAAQLGTKKIKMIRVSSKGTSHTESVDDKNATLFMEVFNCLLEKQAD